MATLRLLRQQFGQLIDRSAPARGMAFDCIGTSEFLVANDELRAWSIRRDGDAHFRFNVGMVVGRLYDPREDDLRGRLDDAIRTSHNDSRRVWDMVGEAVRTTLAEIELEYGKPDRRSW